MDYNATCRTIVRSDANEKAYWVKVKRLCPDSTETLKFTTKYEPLSHEQLLSLMSGEMNDEINERIKKQEMKVKLSSKDTSVFLPKIFHRFQDLDLEVDSDNEIKLSPRKIISPVEVINSVI